MRTCIEKGESAREPGLWCGKKPNDIDPYFTNLGSYEWYCDVNKVQDYKACKDCLKAAYGTLEKEQMTIWIDIIGQNGNDGAAYEGEEIIKPSYYDIPTTGRLEDWVKHMPMFMGTAIKYLARCGKKDDSEQEIIKAISCLNIELERVREIKRLENV